MKPHRIAIFVFLCMAALFFCVPLYVVVITSLKTMDQIRARRDTFALRTSGRFRAGTTHVFEAFQERIAAGSVPFLDVDQDFDPEPLLSISLSIVTLRDGDLGASMRRMRCCSRCLSALFHSSHHVPLNQDHRRPRRVRTLGHRPRPR